MNKISADHLSRQAYVYIRQSTPDQVQHNLESQRLQYALVDRARQLGWPEVTVIDDDQGRSGSGIHRPGFECMLAALCEGKIGAVFCVEASRLARNGRDWETLLEFCGVVNALLVDRDDVYDPRLPNDRLMLGMKGKIAEMELSTFRQRSQAALEQKAKRGELFGSVPIGYLHTQDDRIEKDPDRRICEAIDLVFAKFREFGSARQVLLWLRQEHIALPAVKYGPTGRQIVWKLPGYSSLLRMLSNPVYSGAYTFGRTKTLTRIENGRKRVIHGNRLQQQHWRVLIVDHHDGYITWDEYQENLSLLANNANMKSNVVRGAVRHGEALLAGLLRCGHCGHKLHVAYSGATGKVRRYECRGAHVNQGSSRCIHCSGWSADELVSEELLRHLAPLGVQASLQAIERGRLASDERTRQKELALEQARYEVGRAQRHYEAVDPLNRLVAAELERRWNETLKAQSQLEEELEVLRQTPSNKLSQEAQEELLRLGRDLPRLWHHPASSVEIKKRILRTVVKEILVSINGSKICLLLHWQGGDHTELKFERKRNGQHRYATDSETIDLVQKLARTQSDSAIANLLNRLGRRTAHGHTWTASRVGTQRREHGIAAYCESDRRACGELLLEEVATALNVSRARVLRLIDKKLLPAAHACVGAPWVIRKEDFEAYLRGVEPSDSPQSANPNQLSFESFDIQ
jgi:excisionase family DNA binding protein